MLCLYNSLSREKGVFGALNPPLVTLYTCGPTVYGPGHLGHARSYVTFDLLKRVLTTGGFKVRHVLNITDVHDDMIKEAQGRGVSIFELANEHIPQFYLDLKELNIRPADLYPRVTEVIPEIIKMIKALVDKGYAYVADDGSVYYQVSKFPNYGRLSGIKLKETVSGTRVKTDKYERDAPTDFALWKAEKSGVVSWESPWGKGRPGWHIECSVMAKEFLGETIDIHAGAMDLKFPHHENEIAQCEAVNGVKFVRFWVHAGLLDVEEQKMSKSLGNIFTLEDLKKRGFTPLDFRYLTFTTHYRSRLNFTWEGLAAAQSALKRLRDFAREISATGPAAGFVSRPSASLASLGAGARRDALRPRHPSPSDTSSWQKYRKEFRCAINDDLNLPQALAVVWDLVKQARSDESLQKQALGLLLDFDQVLGLKFGEVTKEQMEVPIEIQKLLNKREKMRKQNQFDKADKLRDIIESKGHRVEDRPEGPIVRKSESK